MKLFPALNFCYEEFTMHIYMCVCVCVCVCVIKVRIYWFDTNMR
jgi:hypothetical protein